VSRPRTLAGSAVPLLLLIGLVGFAPAQAAAAPATDDDQRALAILRRAVDAAASLGYTGTQVVSAWPAGGSTTRLLEIQQWPGGRRLVSVHDPHTGGPGTGSAPATVLTDLSLRALAALSSAYQVRVAPPAGAGQVAGRPTTTVVALRGRREVARLWLDDETGLLLRQDVFDSAGRLHRMAAFIDVRLTPPPAVQAPDGRARSEAARLGGRAATAATTVWRQAGGGPSAGAAPGPLSRSRLARWCSEAECPPTLPGGYQLLDARRGRAAGADVLHLVYGDGLSAISVFLQPGRLDPERLGDLKPTSWAGEDVYVGDGWPLRMTWQGGTQVVTVVSDAAAADLRAAVAALPRDPAEPTEVGALATLRRGLRSVLGWMGGD
jgi:hypothetical protein